ncbi:hypothetical protein C0992_002131 [Termitomyces sp. T32_za158]|nr:hypothetical protein C0992_002131 [Termitomyces sp. T32_za158]
MESSRYSLRPRATPGTKKPPGVAEVKGSTLRATPPHLPKPTSPAGARGGKGREEGSEEQGHASAGTQSFSAPANESQGSASADSSLTELESEASFRTTTEENEDGTPANVSSDEGNSVAETLLPPQSVEIKENKISLPEVRSGPQGSRHDPAKWDTHVNVDFAEVLEQARVRMTPEQRELIHARYENLNIKSEPKEDPAAGTRANAAPRPPSRDELKERLRQKKALDKDIQRLQKEIRRNKQVKKRDQRAASEPISPELESMISKVTDRARESRGRGRARIDPGQKASPMSQVTKDSALGRAFECIKEEGDPDSSGSSDATSSSSSEYSNSGDDSDSSAQSDRESSDYSGGSSSDDDKPRRRSSRRKGKKSPKRKTKINKSIIRPTPPRKVQRGSRPAGLPAIWVSGEGTPGTGGVGAWTFYSREASRAPEKWALEKFFKGLFNECFPINYCNKQRNKLQHLRQGKSTVRDYVGELQELFTIVGSTNRKEKVVKLFNGFRPSIQKELYRAGLNPETSEWKRVVRKAEFIEMAESIDLDFGNGTTGGAGTAQNQSAEHGQGGDGTNGNRNGHKRDQKQFKDQKRSKSPSGTGKKTNTSPQYSAKGGTSRPTDAKEAKGKGYRSKLKGDQPRLSKEEEAEYRAQGRCFRCRETGHLARNCPQAHASSSSNPGKPPGLNSYSVNVDLWEAEKLCEEALGGTTKDLFMGLISHGEPDPEPDETDLQPLLEVSGAEAAWPDKDDLVPDVVSDLGRLQPWSGPAGRADQVLLTSEMEFANGTYEFLVQNVEEKTHLAWEEEKGWGRPVNIDSAAARKLGYMLELAPPYPGDPINVLQYKGRRFFAYEILGGKICLWDHVWRRELLVSVAKVTSPGFKAGQWYALKCEEITGYPAPQVDRWQTTLVGDVWAWNAAQVLKLGSPYCVPDIENAPYN